LPLFLALGALGGFLAGSGAAWLTRRHRSGR
jgi:hypothetical protein